MESTTVETNIFLESLRANGRSPEIPESEDAYGWLVGDWEIEVDYYFTDVKERGIKGEVHFSWVLEGRAIQDTWIAPRRFERNGSIDPICNMFGCTLRVWDKSIQAWRVTWTNPLKNLKNELIGRWVNNEVVQLGINTAGQPIRWIFTDITSDSFTWVGESLDNDGRTWNPGGRFRARRIS